MHANQHAVGHSHLRVFPRDPRRPGADRRATELNKFDLIGQCELAIVPHNGAVLSGPFVPSSKTPATGNVTLDRMPKLLNAELVSPQGEVAGMVELEMAYVPIISEEEDKRRRVSADGDLHKAFLVLNYWLFKSVERIESSSVKAQKKN